MTSFFGFNRKKSPGETKPEPLPKSRSPPKTHPPRKPHLSTPLPPLNVFDPIHENPFNSNFLDMIKNYHQRTDFLDFSIFKQDDPFRQEAKDKIEGNVNFSSPAEDRAFGVIFGMAIGDAIGGRLEFQPVQYDTKTLLDMGKGPGGSFQLQPGQWTDDSSMGFCLADSLIWNKGWNQQDCMQRFLAWWFFGYNNAFRYDNKRESKCSIGLGGNIKDCFMSYISKREPYTIAGDKNTSGNGSIMRSAAVPVYYHDNIEEGMRISRKQSKTTHQGDEAAECCRLLTFIAIKCINGEKIKDFLNNLGETFKSELYSIQCLANSECEMKKTEFGKWDEDRNWNWKSPDFKYSPTRSRRQPGYIGSYAMDATAMSLHCIWTTESVKDAILKAVNHCGDADSIGSVTGQLAGAAYGISTFPKDWIQAIQQWDGGDIALRAHYLFNKSYSK